MSVLNFQPGPRKSRIPGNKKWKLRLLFLLVFTGVSALIASTFAFNPTISVNGNQPIEFGQGIQFLTTCSGEEKIYVTAGSEFQADENKFLLTDLAFSHVPDSCLGKQFLVSAYNSSEQLNLDTDINIVRVQYQGELTNVIYAGESGITPVAATITHPGAADGFGTFTIHLTGERPESQEVKTLTVLSRNGLGGNGSSNNPGLSAYQIHRDWPNLPSGLYWVKNPNINNGVAIQIYADMNPAHDGGGWTLLIANGQKNWTFNEVPQINQATPPGSESELLGYTGKYSILLWGDFLKKNPSDFQYRIDADEFWNHGGVWSVKNNYSFMSTSPNNTNIISNFDWYGGYLNTGIEQRMPFLMDCTADITAFLTTTSQGCTTEWWGTLVQGGSWPHGVVPWIAVTQTNEYQNPSRIWYWVR